MQERRRSNVRINYQSPLYSKLSDVARKELNSLDTTAPEEYFRLSVEIDSVYEQVLGRLGQEVRASRGAIIELHENWTFSQTTHRHIQRTYAAKKKHRGKEAPALSKGGPVLDYRDMYPTEQCGLQRYYRAHMLQDATLEGYLARARESNRNARNALTAERG
ncbi:hypothetical protein A3F56_01950 [Candidatus Kaiserbacteria bacterium RIFCSPHIGHO2_12_FULL_55_13]|nr:MAG: hypothetical protein A3F56_01950 [Candidatus Kaiserbacteria bacterium RIFCSPHIGHO2_12_FULL_55_13]OGG83186.1 MAG: hypothetical protein A3A42_01305 [Candidatus Kaiserbacteria bacterium RIFCSPLOWO2_01_FULL_55_25]